MSEIMAQLSQGLADTVAAAGAGIVRVEGRRRLAATGIAWREDLVVTAHHVLRRDDGIKVGLPGGETVPATLVGRDANNDLAVLRVEAGLSPLAQASDDAPVRVGNLVLAIGRPGKDLQATLGIVSAIGTGRLEGAIQTDVVMYPGFSGGPLVDASGHVRGMNTSIMRGTSLAVASHTIERTVAALLEHGHIRQGYLGIGAQPVRLPEALAHEIGQETGLMVASVESGSPAEQGGILLGDIVIALDGEGTPTLDALLSLLGSSRVGQAVPVAVVRGGEQQSLTVTVGEKE